PRDAADPDDSQNASVPAVIGWWGDRCREEGLLGPRRTPRAAVAGECAAILGVLGAVACRWWVADLAAAVEAVAWRVRSALGEVEPRWVRVDAPCPDCTLVTLVRFTATGAVQCTACRFVAAGEVFGGWLAGVVAGVVADDGVGDHRVDVSS
ncbi:MAG: hypothetical protein L0H84_15110, partial [Pseudonocardia sp.]|nr:hypothetical protein [Pseudonocardia sp.]